MKIFVADENVYHECYLLQSTHLRSGKQLSHVVKHIQTYHIQTIGTNRIYINLIPGKLNRRLLCIVSFTK